MKIRVFGLSVEGEEHEFLFEDLEDFTQRLAEIEETTDKNKVIVRTLDMDETELEKLRTVEV